MKKNILVVFLLLLAITTGCDSMMNTPTKRVEDFLNSYQRQDDTILTQLEENLNKNEEDLTDSQKETYKTILKKQYKDLTYTVKQETIDGNNATVTVEIEVYDYKSTLNNAELYYTQNQDKFKNEKGEVDLTKYMDYKIEKMQETNDRIKYTLNLTLTRSNKKWIMNDITETDRQKIHGLYD